MKKNIVLIYNLIFILEYLATLAAATKLTIPNATRVMLTRIVSNCGNRIIVSPQIIANIPFQIRLFIKWRNDLMTNSISSMILRLIAM